MHTFVPGFLVSAIGKNLLGNLQHNDRQLHYQVLGNTKILFFVDVSLLILFILNNLQVWK